MLHCTWESFYWVCFLKFGSNNSWRNLFRILTLHPFFQSLELLFQIHCHSFLYWHSVLVPFPFCSRCAWIFDLLPDSKSKCSMDSKKMESIRISSFGTVVSTLFLVCFYFVLNLRFSQTVLLEFSYWELDMHSYSLLHTVCYILYAIFCMYHTEIQWRNIPSGVYWMCTNRDHTYKLYFHSLFPFWIFWPLIFWLLKWISWSKLESEHLPLATGFGWEMGLIIALHMIHSIDPINVSALLYICKIAHA